MLLGLSQLSPPDHVSYLNPTSLESQPQPAMCYNKVQPTSLQPQQPCVIIYRATYLSSVIIYGVAYLSRATATTSHVLENRNIFMSGDLYVYKYRETYLSKATATTSHVLENRNIFISGDLYVL